MKRTKKPALTLRKVQLQKLRDEISEVLGAQFGAIDTFSEEVFLLCEKARTMLPPRELREWLTKDVAALRKAEEILIRHMIGHVAIYVEAIGDKIQADASAEYCEMATDAKGTVSDLIASLEERLAGLEQLRVGRPSNDLKKLYSRLVELYADFTDRTPTRHDKSLQDILTLTRKVVGDPNPESLDRLLRELFPYTD